MLTDLLAKACSSCFTTQDHLSRADHHPSPQHTSIMNQENALLSCSQVNLVETFFSVDLLTPQVILTYVKLTKNSNNNQPIKQTNSLSNTSRQRKKITDDRQQLACLMSPSYYRGVIISVLISTTNLPAVVSLLESLGHEFLCPAHGC